MFRRLFVCLIMLLVVEVATDAEGSTTTHYPELRHEAVLMGRLGNHPNVCQFIGAVTTPAVVNDENPLAVDQMEWVESAAQDAVAAPGSPECVESIAFEFFNLDKLPSVSSEGIVHRDIAARNFWITTASGNYASADGELMLFGNDGSPSLRDASVGPVRWMAPNSLRLFSTDPSAGPDDFFDLLAGSSFTVTYAVPEPSTVGLLAVASGLLCWRHRR